LTARLWRGSEREAATPIFDRSGRIAAPSWGDLFREARAYFRASGFRAPAGLEPLPAGDGHPVIVLPPFFCSDRMTAGFRSLLRALGYAVEGWGAGVNLGPTAAAAAASDALLERVTRLQGRRASLIGYSLGGVFARAIAAEYPGRVRRVITVCSPFRLPTASPIEPIYRALSRWHAAEEAMLARIAAPPPVPTTAIYTREDGVVAWTSCRDDEAPDRDNVAVVGAHTTMLCNPRAIRIIAERLALPEVTPRPSPD